MTSSKVYQLAAWSTCAISLSLAQTALAGTFASAALDPLSFQLIDLDAADDVVPTLTWVQGAAVANLNLNQIIMVGQTGQNSLSTAAGAAPQTLVNDIGGGPAQASWDGAALKSSGSSVGAMPSSFDAKARLGNSLDLLTVELSPHSLLLVSARANLVAGMWQVACGPMLFDAEQSCEDQGAAASVGMSLNYRYSDGTGVGSVTDNAAVGVNSNPHVTRVVMDPIFGQNLVYFETNPDATQQLQRTVMVSFANTSSLPQKASLSVYADVFGYGSLAAVPEPSNSLMWGVGALGLLAASRRARRK